VATGAAKPVVKIEVAESGIEVIKPHQAYDAAAKPNAFRVACGAVDGLCGFSELIGLALAVLGGICRRGLFALVLSARIPALGDGASKPDQKGKT
jgi:hypothetical protein